MVVFFPTSTPSEDVQRSQGLDRNFPFSLGFLHRCWGLLFSFILAFSLTLKSESKSNIKHKKYMELMASNTVDAVMSVHGNAPLHTSIVPLCVWQMKEIIWQMHENTKCYPGVVARLCLLLIIHSIKALQSIINYQQPIHSAILTFQQWNLHVSTLSGGWVINGWSC